MSSLKMAYHHGDLRTALLDAARAIVAEEGIGGLTLRACARRAGVSHGAPLHHFGSLGGLLAEFAADGYERLAASMDEAIRASSGDVLHATGRGYVTFAVQFPQHFRVMTRSEASLADSPRLRDATAATKRRLHDALRHEYEAANGVPLSDAQLTVRAALAWSCVHGYACLWVDGLLDEPDAGALDALLTQLHPALIGA